MSEPTVIVAGITRSGLSLTMQMLHAGGYPCVGHPPAFEEYPVGEIPWPEVRGKAVKVVDTHLHLPPPGRYFVIRLLRDLREQARSLNKWTSAMFRLPPAPISRIVASLRRDYATIDEWCFQQEKCLELRFEDILARPARAALDLCDFLGWDLDPARMREVVVTRPPECYGGLLEAELIRRYA